MSRGMEIPLTRACCTTEHQLSTTWRPASTKHIQVHSTGSTTVRPTPLLRLIPLPHHTHHHHHHHHHHLVCSDLWPV